MRTVKRGRVTFLREVAEFSWEDLQRALQAYLQDWHDDRGEDIDATEWHLDPHYPSRAGALPELEHFDQAQPMRGGNTAAIESHEVRKVELLHQLADQLGGHERAAMLLAMAPPGQTTTTEEDNDG